MENVTQPSPLEMEEINKCADDFVYFCEKYIKIEHPKRGLIPFILHDYQKRYIEHISNNRFSITKKFRQGGFTTLNMSWLLWRLLFKLDERNMMLVKSEREIISTASWIFKRMLDNLPEFLKPKFGKRNNHHVENLETGSSVHFRTPEAAKGCMTNYLFLDEPAFIKDMDRHWKAMWPTLSTGGHCVATSTVNGKQGWFYETYIAAEREENEFKIFKTNYKEHPDYNNEAWVEKTKKNLGVLGWLQEVLCGFLESAKPKEQEDFLFFNDREAISTCDVQAELDLLQKDREEFLKFAEGEKVKAQEQKKAEEPKLFKQSLSSGASDNLHQVKSTQEEKELLRKLRKKAAEEGKVLCSSIKDNTDSSKLSYEHLWEDNGKYPITMITFDDIQRPNNFRGYYWSDVAEEIAEEHIFVNEDHSLDNAINAKKQNLRDLEDRVNAEVYSDDMLILAGILGEDERSDVQPTTTGGNANQEILAKVKETGDFPENLKVAFSDNKLCVNGVATNINEFDLCCLYSGLVAFTSRGKAVTKIAKLICKRITPLFGIRKES